MTRRRKQDETGEQLAEKIEAEAAPRARRKKVRPKLSEEDRQQLALEQLVREHGEESISLLAEEVLREGEEAKVDPAKFFELAFVHEKTGEPLQVQPHQRLQFRFMQDFRFCVIRTPVFSFKSYTSAAFSLWLLGHDCRASGMVASRTQEMAERTLKLCKDYLENPERQAAINLAFPNLQPRPPERDSKEKWTQAQITVDRPPGIRDPSLLAIGKGSGKQGLREEFAIVDDLVGPDDASFDDQRESTTQFFYDNVKSRVDPQRGRIVVINTPWDLRDLTYTLEREGQVPTLIMNIYGEVELRNVPEGWGSEFLEPSIRTPGKMMLRGIATDPEEMSFCPSVCPPEQIRRLRKTERPLNFARWYLCEPQDEATARCQRSWIEACKRRGKGLGFEYRYDGPNPVYCGIDLSIGQGKAHDRTVFFVFELLPDFRRRVLWIESGRPTGAEIIRRLLDFHDRYGSIFAIENVSGQDFLRQWIEEAKRRAAPSAKGPPRVWPITTNAANKRDVDFGVESIFAEFQAEQWIFPSGEDGDSCPHELEAFLEEDCLQYNPSARHTADRLMAAWFARERARKGGGGRDPAPRAGRRLSMAGGGGF